MKHLLVVSTTQTPIERALAEVIDEARLVQGWSQQEMAARASVHLPAGGPLTQTTLSRMLKGQVSLRVDYVEALAKALDMRLSALCRLAEGEVPATARALPINPGSDSGPNASHRRRPRRATEPSRGA